VLAFVVVLNDLDSLGAIHKFPELVQVSSSKHVRPIHPQRPAGEIAPLWNPKTLVGERICPVALFTMDSDDRYLFRLNERMEADSFSRLVTAK
jgi:hypothetical protein